MPFPFIYLCNLLSELSSQATHDPPYLPDQLRNLQRKTILTWFKSHRRRIDASDTDAVALLSALFPEQRTDRVYGIREKTLTKIVCRCLCYGAGRRRELELYTNSGWGDLGECVERTQKQAENPKPQDDQRVTVEEIDYALEQIAARCHFSSSGIRNKRKRASLEDDPDPFLGQIMRRLSGVELKWLVRLILKNYMPVILPDQFVLRTFHFLLPELLKVQNTFDAAIALLHGPVIKTIPPYPGQDDVFHRERACKVLRPKLGTKVGRESFLKARSIEHCVKLAKNRHMSLEVKYDGEYCQVHIDLSKGNDWIQIFSKSGKDSTVDRRGIHSTLRSCLRIGQQDCKFSSNCILEGELVVVSDKTNKILDFHKLRKHIPRSGVYLGTEHDSQPHDHEHLMIVLFDVLLVDDESLLAKSYIERRKRLKALVKPIERRAGLAMREEIHFSSPGAMKRLLKAFARGIANRYEGFVLKPCDEPYFSLSAGPNSAQWIKLKKEYIQGLGDTAEFAVIGAGYCANDIVATGPTHIRWTKFHIACLENKEEVNRFRAKPLFRFVGIIDYGITKVDLQDISRRGIFSTLPYDPTVGFTYYEVLEEPSGCDRPAVQFKKPFVFEICGTGWDKPSGKNFWMLRFPRLVKIHWDRTYKESISFHELQQAAATATTAPAEHFSEEERLWIQRLERGDGATACDNTSQGDTSTQSTTKSRISQKYHCRPGSRRPFSISMLPLVRQDTLDDGPPVGSRPTTSEGWREQGTDYSAAESNFAISPTFSNPPGVESAPLRELQNAQSNSSRHSQSLSEPEQGAMETGPNEFMPAPVNFSTLSTKAFDDRSILTRSKKRKSSTNDSSQVDTSGFLSGTPSSSDKRLRRCPTCEQEWPGNEKGSQESRVTLEGKVSEDSLRDTLPETIAGTPSPVWQRVQKSYEECT